MSDILVRVARFAGALARHAAAGCPRRTADQVRALYAICAGGAGRPPCVLFDGRACLGCGCHVSDREDWWLNKLAWAGERCPAGRW